MGGEIVGILVATLALVCIGGPFFYLGVAYGSKLENRTWLSWLKTVTYTNAAYQCRERFFAKNGKPEFGPPHN